ncbi:MAG: pyridoxal phosphate-dependent aminotransferase [Propionibacteriaceae bacterium]
MADNPYLIPRLQSFNSTIFAEMTQRALAVDAVNLGQGFPDTDGPPEMLRAAIEAIEAGHNQYPPGIGIPPLRQAISQHQKDFYGLEYDPDTEVLVTVGATEAITATVLALCETGDEIIVLEPTYDSYAAAAAMAGAVLKPVTLGHPDYRLDVDALRAAVTPRTKMLLINSPHNPTSRVLDREELSAIAALAVERDLVVLCDEVYEHLTFDGREHLPLATFDGMRDRTICVSSAGKTFNCTGWKVGWACASPALIAAIKTTKQFLTFVGSGPFQYGVTAALSLPPDYVHGVRDRLQAGRDQLAAGLREAGLEVHPSEGTYFLTVDIASIGERDGLEFCRGLPDRVGVAAVPSQTFYADPAKAPTLVRFAFSKRPEVIAEGARRLATLGS